MKTKTNEAMILGTNKAGLKAFHKRMAISTVWVGTVILALIGLVTFPVGIIAWIAAWAVLKYGKKAINKYM